MDFGFKKNIVVFDVETTGFNPYQSEITEVGMVKLDGSTFEIMGQISTLIKIDGEISKQVTDITGITKAMCEQYGLDKDVVKKMVQEFCKDCILVAHNAPFDLEFFEVHFDIEPKYFFDTLTMSRAIDSAEKSHKLGEICARKNINLTGAHRALNDVFATKDLLKLFFEEDMDSRKYINTLSKFRLKYRPKALKEVI